MSPHEHHTRHRTSGSETLSATWDRYLASRGPRAHGDLLKAVDSHIRSETRRLLGRGHPMLEEVAQEALVGAARRIATDERPDFPVAYVRKIVHNKVVDLLRQESKRREREQQHWSPEIDPVEASMSAEWHDFLDTLRTIVSDDEFWTLVLRYHFDYSYGEIGDLLDKEPNAVRQIAHRGRHKCREHLTRLEGRVPAWVLLPDSAADGVPDGSPERPEGGATTSGDGTSADTSGPEAGTGPEVGGPAPAGHGGDPTATNDARGGSSDAPTADQPGLREPRRTDPADRSRRPSAGSDSGAKGQRPAAVFPTIPVARALWRRLPRLRPDGPGRPFGSPMTVVPLTLMVALPLLFQVNRALDATVVGTSVRTAQIVDDDDDIGPTRPPSGPTISVIPSTAPTDEREAPSTSAPPPTGSDPPSGESSTTIDQTTTSADPSTTTEPVLSTTVPSTIATTTATTAGPPSTPSTTTPTTPTTSRASTAPPPTSAPSTQPPTTTTTTTTTTTSTTVASTTVASTTRATTTTTGSTTTESTTTSSSTTSTTGRTTTSGRDPGDGNEPPPNQ